MNRSAWLNLTYGIRVKQTSTIVQACLTAIVTLTIGGIVSVLIKPGIQGQQHHQAAALPPESVINWPPAWNFDYHPIEKYLLNIQINESVPKANQANEALLRNAVLAFPDNIDNITLERIIWLSGKTLPEDGGNLLSIWLLQYHRYHQDVLALNQATDGADRHLHKLIELQQHHFGKQQASLLFARQHQLGKLSSQPQRWRGNQDLAQTKSANAAP